MSDDKKPNQETVSHLKVVPLNTSSQDNQKQCVLKLRELLARAEQGHFNAIAVVAKVNSLNSNTFSFHWTPHAGNDLSMVGALTVFKKILVDAMKLTVD